MKALALVVMCLLTGCAIDGTQDVNPYTAPAVAPWTPSADMMLPASEVPKSNNFSWAEQVGIERGLPDGHLQTKPNNAERAFARPTRVNLERTETIESVTGWGPRTTRARDEGGKKRTYGSRCPCNQSQNCIGPRGGQYCITSGGNRHYR